MKKMVSVLLCVVLLSACFSCLPPNASADMEGIYSLPCHALFSMMRNGKMLEKPELMVGDIDFSGTVDVSDALLALKYSIPKNNPHTGMWWVVSDGHVYTPGWGRVLERSYIAYYSSGYDRSQVTPGDARFWHYFLNSALMADVNSDLRITASDALMILQFSVGKRDCFIRQGRECNGGDLYYYVMWPDEWVPGAYYHCYNEEYDAMDTTVRQFDSLYPPVDPYTLRYERTFENRMKELNLYPPRFLTYLQQHYSLRDWYPDWLRENGYLNQ